MLHEINIAGVLVAPVAVYAAITIPISLALRVCLARTGFINLLWHPALFEFAAALCIFSLLMLLF